MILIYLFYTYLFSSWSLYRYLTNFSEPVDEFIFKPVIWLVPIILIVVWYERRSISKSLGLDFSNFRNDAVFGAATAIGLYTVVMMVVYIKFGELTVNPLSLGLFGIITFLLASTATAVTEEVTFRGFILTRLAKVFKNRRIANIITTILFLIIHLPIYTFTHVLHAGEIMNVMLLSGIISLVDGYLFYHRKGIVAPIASHAAWNFVAILIR